MRILRRPRASVKQNAGNTPQKIRGLSLAAQAPEGCCKPALEEQLQAKLNLAGIKRSRGFSEDAAGDAVGKVRACRRARQEEIGVVECIEELSTELSLEAFRDSDVLEERLIGVEVRRADEGVAPEVAVAAGARSAEERIRSASVSPRESRASAAEESIRPALLAGIEIVAIRCVGPVVVHSVQVEIAARIARPVGSVAQALSFLALEMYGVQCGPVW